MVPGSLIKKFEHIVIASLMVMMGIVVLLATVELGWVLIKDILGMHFTQLDGTERK